jgi:hypothetical protein
MNKSRELSVVCSVYCYSRKQYKPLRKSITDLQRLPQKRAVFKYSFHSTNKRLSFTDVASRYGYMAPVTEERSGKKHCRNTEEGKKTYLVQTQSQWHILHHKSHIHWFGNWTRSSMVTGHRLTHGAECTPGVTPGIIILSNFMPSLHKVNKFGGDGKARVGGLRMFVFLSACILSWTSEWVSIWFWNSTPHITREFDLWVP